MKITPLNNTETVRFTHFKVAETDKKQPKYKSSYKDPENVIPTGAYKIFALENKIILSMLLFYSIMILIISILITLIATNSFKAMKIVDRDYSWSWFIIPVGLLSYSFFKFIMKLIEFSSIKKALKFYRIELEKNTQAIPTFIAQLYKKLIKQQIHHNWFLVFSIFYMGIFTLFIWYFKDKNYHDIFLNFKAWISALSPNPQLLSIILSLIILGNIVIWAILTIARKKRTNDIQDYFGYQIVKDTEIDQMKIKMNKGYLKLFFLSIAIILILPIITLLIVKRIILKRKK
ncbi:MSC_0882 family membrane protein [Mycoplasma sp. 480]|uniref:MSC_0882 family membrane protein n=1 Tax=Mycoplasma sp. 480 TaxID=3440155 RepID=UPI003F510E81